MKLINQSYVIEYIAPNILQQIEKAGRVCWKSEEKIGCLLEYCSEYTRKLYDCQGNFIGSTCNNCKHHSSLKFAKMIIKKKHDAILEFGDVQVRLITNRGVTHELVRHRIANYAQESTRYVNYKDGIEFIKPVWWKEENEMNPNSNEWLFSVFCEDSELCYRKMINNGWRPEEAREILPNCTKTEIIFKANIRSLRNVFELRTSKKAHPMIRHLLTPLLKELQQKIPVVFDDIGGE